jgi:hypothetical protein
MWKTVVATDASGREVERWELVNWAALDAAIPAVDSGWESDILLDRRPRPAVSRFESMLRDVRLETDDLVFDVDGQSRENAPPALRIVKSVQRRDWKAVDRDVARTLKNQPGQPFLLVVKAWSLSFREGDHADEIAAALKDVARSGHADLLDLLGDRAFARLGNSAVYEILLQLPIDRRRPVDWDKLARCALRAGEVNAAVGHLHEAVRTAGTSGDEPERARLLVELLLKANRTDEGIALAGERAARRETGLAEFASLIETLHKGGAKAAAARLIAEALSDKRSIGEMRCWLLLRRADLEPGIERRRTMLAAVEALPAGSPNWIVTARSLLGEFGDAASAEQAAVLAAETNDERLGLALKLRHIELLALNANTSQAADAGWKLYGAKQLPANRFDWLSMLLSRAHQEVRLIRLAEDRLRGGMKLADAQLDALAAAYESAGRPDAARRARTSIIGRRSAE